MKARFIFPTHVMLHSSIKETFSNWSVVPAFAIFEKLWKKKVHLAAFFSSKMTTAGCLSNSFVLSVSGHRVKLEDQKMQFSDRLSEIERYQRSMRIGPMNNNPRPIHQNPLSTTPGEDRSHMQPQATTNSKNHPQLCKILLCLGK